MNDILDHDDSSLARHDRELTLGTGTILGIFFGLVVLCGACFGVGYIMGHKSVAPPLTLADAPTDALATSSVAKPAAGSPMDNLATTPAVIAPPTPKPAPIVRKPPPPPVAENADTSVTAVRSSETATKPPVVHPVTPAALLPSATGTPAASGSIMVQVAAVSHQEDADLLVGALRARGYTVAARPASGDSLIHVQVGPFSNKPAAEAMRQKLLGDGYNAMLKY